MFDALSNLALSGFTRVIADLPGDAPLVSARRRVCAGCILLRQEQLGIKGPWCAGCKCYVLAKTRCSAAHCPIGKW